MTGLEADANTGTKPDDNRMIRVMVVDDSAVIRHFITRYIESDPDLKVVSSVANGQMAVDSAGRNDIDVVVLDIEMPVMDGLTALPLILAAQPGIKVIVASSLTSQGAAETIKAFSLGASECLAKPTSAQDLNNADDFRRDLVAKAKGLGCAAKAEKKQNRIKALTQNSPAEEPNLSPKAARNASPRYGYLKQDTPEFELNRTAFSGRPDAIAVGSSTGGPQALVQFFKGFSEPLRQPVFVTQHMPALFTKYLAEQISRETPVDCREAEDGEEVQEGRVYLAPGDHHMVVVRKDGKDFIQLNQDEPENYCRPSVEPMLRSLTDRYGKKLICVMLTGMGADGAEAAKKLVEAGGAVIAQDKESSVVWGMPGAVATAGLCSAVLPLADIAPAVETWARKVV